MIVHMVQLNNDLARTEFSQRLHTAMNYAGHDVRGRARKLASQFSVSDKGAGKWLNGEAIPETHRIAAIALWLGVNGEWLLTGKGQPNNSTDSFNAAKIPLYNQSDFEKFATTQLPTTNQFIASESLFNKNPYAILFDDAAMLNDFKKNDRLIIEPAMQPIPGDYIAVRSHLAHKTFIRKYRALGMSSDGNLIFEAKPINDDYPTMKSDIDLLEVLGVVIEHRRGLRVP